MSTPLNSAPIGVFISWLTAAASRVRDDALSAMTIRVCASRNASDTRHRVSAIRSRAFEVRRRKCDREGSARGCLLICVAPLVDDAEVRQFLQKAAAGGAALVEGRFRDAISAGEIPSDFPAAERATQVTDLVVALRCVR